MKEKWTAPELGYLAEMVKANAAPSSKKKGGIGALLKKTTTAFKDAMTKDGEEPAVPSLMTVEAAAKAVGRLKGKLGSSTKSLSDSRPSSGHRESKDIMVEAGAKGSNSLHPEEMLLRVIGEVAAEAIVKRTQ